MKNFSLKKLFGRKHKEAHVHPFRDWYLVVTICLLLMAASAAWNVWLFWEVTNGKTLTTVPEQAKQSEAHTVTDVQNVFKSRAAERVNYESNYQFVDPSN